MLTRTLIFALFFSVTIIAQAQSVRTDPVGFVKITVPAGKIQPISFPLKDSPAFTAAATAVGASSIDQSSAGWQVNAFGPFSTNPFIIRFLSGNAIGRHFKISSNTSNSITVTTNGIDLTTIVNSGDRFEIVPVDTLGSSFGNNAPDFLSSSDANVADNILIRGSSSWLIYYNNGTNWLRVGAGSTPQNNTALLPEQGILIVRRATTDLTLLLSGAVPTTSLFESLPAGKIFLLANEFPVPRTLNDFGLHQSNAWLKGTDANAVDVAIIRGSSSWLIYYHDGTNWLRVGAGSSPQNPTIPVGGSFLVVRRGGNDVALQPPLPYNLTTP